MASDLSSVAFRLYGRCFVRCFLSAGITVAVGEVLRMGIMMEGKMVGDCIINSMEKFRI